MKSKSFLQLISVVFMFLISFSASAKPLSEAEAQSWAEAKGAELLNAFRLPDISTRYQRLDELFDLYVDSDYISRFVTGRYYKTMTTEQKQQYRSLFERYVKALYKTFPLDFADTLRYRVVDASAAGEFTTVSALVKADFGEQNQELQLQFRLHRPHLEVQLVDIKLAESSLILSYRNKFYEMIAAVDGDMGFFLEDLEAMTRALEENNRRRLEKKEI